MIVKCLLCAETFDLTSSDTRNLITHINEAHYKKQNKQDLQRGLNLISKSRQNQESTKYPNKNNNSMDNNRRRGGGQYNKKKFNNMYSDLSRQCSAPCLPSMKKNMGSCLSETGIVLSEKKLYKTSISKWEPGFGKVLCPNCGVIKRVIAKTMTFKKTTTPIEACCLLTCWPLVCLSFLFPAPEKEFLYCSNCHYYLGLYDPAQHCLKPSKKVLYQIDGCCSGITH